MTTGLLELTELNEGLALDHPGCEGYDCSAAATWRQRRTCCAMSILTCDKHKAWVVERNRLGWLCINCGIVPTGINWVRF